LAQVAGALAEAGEQEQAAKVIGQAEAAARALTDPYPRAQPHNGRGLAAGTPEPRDRGRRVIQRVTSSA
jgi:hypothetical protein